MLKPIKATMLVKLAPKSDTTASGLILARPKRDIWMEIVDKGSTVSPEYTIGQKVVVELGKFRIVQTELSTDTAEYAIINESDIIGIMED